MEAPFVTRGHAAETAAPGRQGEGQEWIRPAILRLSAGEAENFAGEAVDGGENKS